MDRTVPSLAAMLAILVACTPGTGARTPAGTESQPASSRLATEAASPSLLPTCELIPRARVEALIGFAVEEPVGPVPVVHLGGKEIEEICTWNSVDESDASGLGLSVNTGPSGPLDDPTPALGAVEVPGLGEWAFSFENGHTLMIQSGDRVILLTLDHPGYNPLLPDSVDRLPILVDVATEMLAAMERP